MTDPYKELREALPPVEKKRWMRAIVRAAAEIGRGME